MDDGYQSSIFAPKIQKYGSTNVDHRSFGEKTTDKYDALKAKNGKFAYGSNYWTHYLKKDKKDFDDYMAMQPADRKKYDDLADDLMVATLLIQDCAKPSILKYLSNQYAINSTNCYPETPIDARALIETFDETESSDDVHKTDDAVVSALVTDVIREHTLMLDPSVAMPDDLSDT